MPSRRALARTFGTGLLVGVAGCLSAVPSVGGPPEVREQSGDSPARLSPTFSELHADSTQTTLVVGDGESQGEQVWVWNGTDQSREVRIEIGDEADAEPWFRESYALDTSANLAIDLRKSRRYVITVGVGDRAETVKFPESLFDCNDTVADVVVRPAEIETTRISTQEKCGGLW